MLWLFWWFHVKSNHNCSKRWRFQLSWVERMRQSCIYLWGLFQAARSTTSAGAVAMRQRHLACAIHWYSLSTRSHSSTCKKSRLCLQGHRHCLWNVNFPAVSPPTCFRQESNARVVYYSSDHSSERRICLRNWPSRWRNNWNLLALHPFFQWWNISQRGQSWGFETANACCCYLALGRGVLARLGSWSIYLMRCLIILWDQIARTPHCH